MSMIRLNPFREFEDIQTRLDRLFSERTGRQEDDTLFRADWMPAVDVQETEKEYVIKADLPEVKKEDVKVTVHDGVMTLEGERKLEKEEKGKKFHRIERAYGRFVRRFTLPDGADEAKVAAEFKDGVLNVRVPKSTIARPKTVEVKVA
ncbi:MAG: heat-shock protein Hsp20 [Acidobacteria bacterium RIFCSPLOWO2_12_FULL_65_11]|nr:MAG: heat-shock protein Hsp20 [Acidobacteria bacterium RIFCSPLOWO2_02_FULL_64_15]OFW34523.1 MAG: heat-shock protein Hsp20 [Acidobacteria bacterium RIFCSPLOWO2_12_FULL_65_11]